MEQFWETGENYFDFGEGRKLYSKITYVVNSFFFNLTRKFLGFFTLFAKKCCRLVQITDHTDLFSINFYEPFLKILIFS